MHNSKFIPFWLVWRKDGVVPRKQHPTRDSAEEEARRLAYAHPGVEFYVLPAKSVYRCQTLSVEHFTEELPF